MNSDAGEKYTSELIKLFGQQGDALYRGHHSLCLTVACLHYLQSRFAQVRGTSHASVSAPLLPYHKLLDHFSKILSLKLIVDRRAPPITRQSSLNLNLEPFRALQALILKKVPLNLVTGLQHLRGQLCILIIQRCDITDLDDVIIRCGGDNSTTLAWSSLKELDFSHNRLRRLGDSLQYLHSLEKVNFSNNQIGKRPHILGEASSSISSSEGSINSSVAVMKPNQEEDERLAVAATEGIESIDNVQFIHLGFNKLRQVPRFGSRARYNLRILNLRNNELINIDGVEELDNLVEMDLTDNLLSKHSSLTPCFNLHHLSVLSLLGNPLCFHMKHRLKTAEHLSYLIDKNSFKLDGKKLSSAEKKVVPTSMTHHHYMGSFSRNSSLAIPFGATPSLDVSVSQSVPMANHVGLAGTTAVETALGGTVKGHGLEFISAPSSPKNESVLLNGNTKGRRRSLHTAKIVDPDEEQSTPLPPTVKPTQPAAVLEARFSQVVIPEAIKPPLSSAKSTEEAKQLDLSGDQVKSKVGGAESRRGQRKGRRGSRRKKKKEKSDGMEELHDSGTLPLMHEERLKKHEDLRLQMTENWLQVSLDKSSSANDDPLISVGAVKETTSSQQPSVSPKSLTKVAAPAGGDTKGHGMGQGSPALEARPVGGDTKGRDRGQYSPIPEARLVPGDPNQQARPGDTKGRGKGQSPRPTANEKLADVILSDVEGEFGPRTSSPDRDFSQDIEGEYYMVERYESDVEEEKGESGGSGKELRHQVIIRLSEGFLEEIEDDTGKVIDRWDLHCLKAAAVESKQWKSTVEQKREVLMLQFNLERRDRRRREYVLMEEGDEESIMDILQPIVQQNQSALSMGNKLECLQCQRVFDMAQAVEQPSDSPEPLRSNTSYRGRSISKLMCPFCHSQILQQSMPRPSVSKFPSWKGHDSPSGATAMADPVTLLTSANKASSGFDVDAKREVVVDGRKRDSVTGEGATGGGGYSENFVGPSLADEALKDSRRSGSQERSGEKRSHDLSLTQDNHVREEVQGAVAEGSPAEVGYLADYGDVQLTKPEASASSGLSNKQEDTSPALQRQSSTFEDTLGPWKSERVKQMVVPDGVEVRDHVSVLSPAVVSSDDGVRDSGMGTASDARGYGEWSDDEGNIRFRHHRDRRDFEEGLGFGRHQDGGEFEEQEVRGGAGGRWGRGYEDLSDEDIAKSPYDFDYEPPYSSPRRTASTSNNPFTQAIIEYSSSVPSQNSMYSHFNNPPTEDARPIKVMDGLNHRRSQSMGYHSTKTATSPSGKRKHYADPFYGNEIPSTQVQGSNRSLGSLKEEAGFRKSSRSSSRKSSLCSLDSDSSRSSRSDANSGERKKNPRSKGDSNEMLHRGYSSGESHPASSQSKPSSNTSWLGMRSKFSRFSSDNVTGGLQTSPQLKPRNREHKRSGGSSGKISSRSSSGENSQSKSHQGSKAYHSSSDSAGGRKIRSPVVFCKDNDPTFIHNSINLYLAMEVFINGEEFRMAFMCPVVKYGEVGELPALVVVSNLSTYIFKIIAPESSEPSKWLKLGYQHSLHKLVYIDHGIAYQYLRVEFRSSGACYTFLMRDDKKCKLCSTELSLCVADAPGSSLRNVGVCPFNIEALRYPDRVRREAIMNRYENAPDRRSPTGSLGRPASSARSTNGDVLVLYRLVHRYNRNTGGRSPVTLVITEDTLFLSKENFAHWPLPRMQDLVPKEALLPPFLDIEQRDITDVEKIILDRDQPNYAIVRFFPENSGYGESRQWRLLMHNRECVNKLVNSIKTPWESNFETSFPVIFK